MLGSIPKVLLLVFEYATRRELTPFRRNTVVRTG